MKLCRIGEIGNEKPALIDDRGRYRDLSTIINDLDPKNINFDTLNKISKIQMDSLPEINSNERIGSCVANPNKFLGIGLNYKDHALEQNLPIPKEPIIFSKFTSCICGPNDDIELPKDSEHTDWEVELGFVIGKKAKYVSEKDALNYVFGFFLVNDVSERNFQKNRELTWDKGKGFDTFGPIGPYIVTLEDLPNFQNLNMDLEVNGQKMQNGNTNQMIFKIEELVSYMSNCMTLLPGDICCTGTPPGVGENMKPPRFLRKGDEISLSIEKLGNQFHKVI
tara:strand:- start:501 stop:1337 length:837 start_codon:yes stop_codon:yes gene_type:complete